MPNSFGQLDTTGLDHFRGIMSSLAELDMRNRLFAAQQERESRRREAVSNIIGAYATAQRGGTHTEDVTTKMPQFGGIEATQSQVAPGLAPQDERAMAAETFGKLQAVDPNAAQDFTQFRKIFKEVSPLEIEQQRQRGRVEIEGMREKARQPYFDYLSGKAKDQASYNQGRLDLARQHEKAWEDLKKQNADVFTMDASGKVSVNKNAPADKKLKLLISLENAQRQAGSAIELGKAIDPNDPYVSRVGKNFDAMQQLFTALHQDIMSDQPAAESYGELSDDELLQMGEGGDTQADAEYARRHPEHTK